MRIRRAFVAVAIGSTALLGGLAPSASAAADSCPTGWVEEWAPPGDIYDANGDGQICTKYLDDGQGNSANSQRGTGQTGYHVDGHNHKDNNTPPKA